MGSFIVREDVILMAVDAARQSLLGLRKDLPMLRGKVVAVHLTHNKDGEYDVMISGRLISETFGPEDPRLIRTAVCTMIPVRDALSALSHSDQAYVLGDMLAMEQLLS